MLGAALFVAGLLQFSDIAIFGVVPNFVLVVIVVAALLLRDLWYLLFLLSVAAFFLKFSPSAELEIVTFFLIGAAVAYACERHVFDGMRYDGTICICRSCGHFFPYVCAGIGI